MSSQRRKRHSRAEMYGLLGSYEASGLGRAEFCRQHQLSAQVFGYWLKRYRSGRGAPPVAGFKEVVVAGLVAPGGGGAFFARVLDGRGLSLEFGREVSASYLREVLSW